jgi:ferredoxin
MATIITSECINCGACEPECPNTAIYAGGVSNCQIVAARPPARQQELLWDLLPDGADQQSAAADQTAAATTGRTAGTRCGAPPRRARADRSQRALAGAQSRPRSEAVRGRALIDDVSRGAASASRTAPDARQWDAALRSIDWKHGTSRSARSSI